jgi:transcriptional regulator with XRE-family HTH domain
MSDQPVAQELPLVAQRLDALFRTRLAPNGKPYSYKHVERVINENAGPKAISHSYIWQLRNGKSTNPTRDVLELLAAFFSVPVSYFFGDDEANRTADSVDMTEALSHGLVHEIATHAAGLSEASQSAILAMIDNARVVEGLPQLKRRSS